MDHRKTLPDVEEFCPEALDRTRLTGLLDLGK
jgi:hypothetical protein